MNQKRRIVNGQGATNINYSTFCVLNTTKNVLQIMSLAAYASETNTLWLVLPGEICLVSSSYHFLEKLLI